MADKRKKRAGVWAKSLAKFLAGDDHCGYKLWLQSTHWVDRLPQSDEDAARMRGHLAKHEAIAERRAAELRAEGWVVKTEDDTAFHVQGARADLTGKCDIVALHDGEALVVDAKGGRPRDADHWQVRLYMWALPRTWLPTGTRIRGQVQYEDRAVDVRAPEAEDLPLIADAMNRATQSTAPPKTPSKWECAFCLLANCDARYVDPHAGERAGGSGGLF